LPQQVAVSVGINRRQHFATRFTSFDVLIECGGVSGRQPTLKIGAEYGLAGVLAGNAWHTVSEL
jgi:hypothetical protein